MRNTTPPLRCPFESVFEGREIDNCDDEVMLSDGFLMMPADVARTGGLACSGFAAGQEKRGWWEVTQSCARLVQCVAPMTRQQTPVDCCPLV